MTKNERDLISHIQDLINNSSVYPSAIEADFGYDLTEWLAKYNEMRSKIESDD